MTGIELLPSRWKVLLEKVKNQNGSFSGLKEESGRYIGALESLRARCLVKRDENGFYSLSDAGEAVLREEHGQGVILRMTQQSAILKEIRKETQKREDLLQERLRQPRVVGQDNFRNIFIVSKLWNSATPIFPPLPGYRQVASGGGYVLLWQNKCFCIDPGLNFLTKFYERRLTPNDIDVIIVTHDHLDHPETLKDYYHFFLSCTTKKNREKGGKRLTFWQVKELWQNMTNC